MNHCTTDADGVSQEFDAEARLEELQSASRYARALGLQRVWLHKPNANTNDPGSIQVYLGHNAPVDSQGKPNQEQRLVALIVRPNLNGDHTIDKLGMDGLHKTAVAGRDDARIHFFRVADEAPVVRSRQLGPGVWLEADGYQPLPPEKGLR